MLQVIRVIVLTALYAPRFDIDILHVLHNVLNVCHTDSMVTLDFVFQLVTP